MVEGQTRIKSVKYITSGEHCDRIRVIRAHPQCSGGQVPVWSIDIEKGTGEETHEKIVFQVNTPTFYSNFFHYRSPFVALQSELLDEERTRTVWSSHPSEFAALFPHDNEDIWRKLPDWRWRIIFILRSAPTQTNFPRQKPYEPCNGISLTDNIVAQHCSDDDFRAYRRALIRNFLGDWIGGFAPGLIKGGDFELIGMSRDAVLMVHEAFLKAAIMTWAINVAGHNAVGPTSTAYLLSTVLSVTGLSLWACFKSSL